MIDRTGVRYERYDDSREDDDPDDVLFGPYYRHETNPVHANAVHRSGRLYGNTPALGGGWPTVQAYRKPIKNRPLLEFYTPIKPADANSSGGPFVHWYGDGPAKCDGVELHSNNGRQVAVIPVTVTENKP